MAAEKDLYRASRIQICIVQRPAVRPQQASDDAGVKMSNDSRHQEIECSANALGRVALLYFIGDAADS